MIILCTIIIFSKSARLSQGDDVWRATAEALHPAVHTALTSLLLESRSNLWPLRHRSYVNNDAKC